MSQMSERSLRVDPLSASVVQSDRDTTQIRRNNSRRYGYSPNSIDYNIYAPLTGSRRDLSATVTRTRRMCKSIEIDTREFQHNFAPSFDLRSGSDMKPHKFITEEVGTSDKEGAKDGSYQYTPYGTPSSLLNIQQSLQDQNSAFGTHLTQHKTQNLSLVNSYRPQSTQVSQYRETPTRIPLANTNPPQAHTEYNSDRGRVRTANYLSNPTGTPPAGSLTQPLRTHSPAPSVQATVPRPRDSVSVDHSTAHFSPRIVFNIGGENNVATGLSLNSMETRQGATAVSLEISGSRYLGTYGAILTTIDKRDSGETVEKEVTQLKDRLETATQQNEKLKELNKLLLRKLMHLHRAVKITS